MSYFAVIDTETTWTDQVMSIGVIIAEAETFRMVGAKYYVLTPEYRSGGMYSHVLFLDETIKPAVCSRKIAMEDLTAWLNRYGVEKIFAYNAKFDKNHLPELGRLQWFDIMRLAAYRQYNPAIPAGAPCCKTGRLKSGFGVEAILRMLSCDCGYRETHNALYDAMDELSIMRLLGHEIGTYIPL